jgi:hypothetical protein
MRRPYYHGPPLDEVKGTSAQDIAELSVTGVDHFLARSRRVQDELARVPVAQRLAVIDGMGRQWQELCQKGGSDEMRTDLAKSTAYSERLIDLELSLVPSVLNAANLERNLKASLIGGPSALERFEEVDGTERYLHRPAGPVLIISSGNSIVPTLIPTMLALVTGNLTLLKPSLSNYDGVVAVLRTLEMVPDTPAKEAMRNALAISYFSHDGPALEHLLSRSRVGVINFWGGEPARSMVARKVAENPNRPRLLVNGPLTGVAWMEAEALDEEAADGLALNMILYDQQLCSSPTLCLFLGDLAKAREFAGKVASHLDTIGKDFPMVLDEGRLFSLNNFRRTLQLSGSSVLSSKAMDNPWTIVLSKGRSALRSAMGQFPGMGLHARRRFIEVVVLNGEKDALDIIADLPNDPAFKGIDKVQTVGLVVNEEREGPLSLLLASTGVYRIVPINDMYMRSAIEPYDGVSLALPFTYTVYHRRRDKSPEEQP